MVAGGFSCPSTAFCSMAVYSSVNGMGVALVPSALKVSRNKGLWITRSFSPARSSAVLMGRRELVTWRKPFSQNPSPIRPLSGSMASSFWPKGPSSTASASASLLKVSGRFSTPKGLISDISVDESGIVISSVPPRRAEVMLTSLPSEPLANSLAFILPPLLACRRSAKWRTAWACGWSSLRPMPTLKVCSLTCAATGAVRAASSVAARAKDLARVLNGMVSCLRWNG